MKHSVRWLIALLLALSTHGAGRSVTAQGPWYLFEYADHWSTYDYGGDHTIALDWADDAPPGGRLEATLALHYQLSCDMVQDKFPGIILTIRYGSMNMDRRVELLRFRQKANAANEIDGFVFREVQLGGYVSYAPVRITWNNPQAGSDCRLIALRAEIRPKAVYYYSTDVAEVALEHAPFVGIRGNQCGNPETDIPLQVRWTATPGQTLEDQYGNSHTGTLIKYNFFYSDEDDTGFYGAGVTSIGQRLATYGRRGDTENHYMVLLKSDGTVPIRRFSPYKDNYFGQNVGHDTQHFNGNYIAGTNHPILSIYGDNNTLGEDGSRSWCTVGGTLVETGHQAVPLPYNPPNGDEGLRDLVYFDNEQGDPWMHWLEEGEQRREERNYSWSADYFYMVLPHMVTSDWQPGANAETPVQWNWWSDWGMSNGRIAGLGVSWANIEAIANGGGSGTIFMAYDPWYGSPIWQVMPGGMRFFRLKPVPGSYESEEFTHRFRRVVLSPSVATWNWPATPCLEANCVPNQGSYISHFTGANCTGTESYYLPYDSWGYSCRSSDGGGVCGTQQRTETNRSYKMGNSCVGNAWPNGNQLSNFVRIYR